MTFVKKTYEDRMSKAIDHLTSELMKLHAGRATTGLVDGIKTTLDYGIMPVNQVANVVILDNHTLKIEPWDKTIVAMIEKAIYDAETGLAPQGMGDYLLVKVPALTTERRQQIAKQLSSYGEDTKISLRQVRQDARDNIRSLADDDEISEDQQHIYEEQIDTMIKMYNEKVDTLIKAKEDDIMSV